MTRTAIASVLFALLSTAAAHWLTLDFRVWTAEGARRLEVATRPLAALPVEMEGPGLERQTLAQIFSHEGAVTLVDFMYTRCVSVCAALGSTFQQMQSTIAESERSPLASKVRLLSITFDPEHDDVAVLAAYATGLKANPRIWRFARVAHPANASVGQRLLDHYQVTVIADGLGGFEHNAALLVVDPAGRLVRMFDHDEWETALAFSRAFADGSAP